MSKLVSLTTFWINGPNSFLTTTLYFVALGTEVQLIIPSLYVITVFSNVLYGDELSSPYFFILTLIHANPIIFSRM